MKVTCLALEPGGDMRPEAEATALADGEPARVLTGSTSAAAGRRTSTAWLAGLGLEPGLLDLLHLGEDETRILPLAESVFFAYPVTSEGEAEKTALTSAASVSIGW